MAAWAAMLRCATRGNPDHDGTKDCSGSDADRDGEASYQQPLRGEAVRKEISAMQQYRPRLATVGRH